MSSVVRGMARSVTGYRFAEATRSAAAVTELIAVALAAQPGEVRPAPDEALRVRIEGYIEAARTVTAFPARPGEDAVVHYLEEEAHGAVGRGRWPPFRIG